MPSSANTGLTRRARLALEELEPRQLLSGYQPTASEQLFLEQLNDARANPAAYGQSIGLDLSTVAPSQPLAFNPNLVQAARDHSWDMNARGYFAHNTPEGTDPGARIAADGVAWTSWGESIAGGSAYPGPADALKGLIIDNGVADLGHRRHLLAIDSVFKGQNMVGVGVIQNGAGPLTDYYTIDSASTGDSRPFITGSIFSDANGNGKYDVGEGVGGVTITVAGVNAIQALDAGGYGIQVNPGTYTVTASGGGLAAPITRTVTVGSTNVRLNFIQQPAAAAPAGPTAADANFIQKVYANDLGRGASANDVNYWASVMHVYGAGLVVNWIEHSNEAHLHQVGQWYAAYLGRTPGADEAQYWATALNLGATEEQVKSILIGSQEAYNRASQIYHSSNPDLNYLVTTFQEVLGRQPGNNELSYFANLFPYVGRGGVAYLLATSQEGRGVMINSYYSQFLHRSASAGEIAYWSATGANLTDIRCAIEGSGESYSKG